MSAMFNVIRSLSVLWPSFVTAGVLEMLVFAVINPEMLQVTHGGPLNLSTQAIYSLTFFVFWGVVSIGGWVTAILAQQVAPRRD